MQTHLLKPLLLLTAIVSVQLASAQTPGPNQTTGSYGDVPDTGTKSEYHDNPADHLHQTRTTVQSDNTGVSDNKTSTSEMEGTSSNVNSSKNGLYTALGIFGIAALIGIYLISLVFGGKPIPKMVAILHGLFAATGLALLIIYSANHGWGPVSSLGVLLVAAVGGFVMFFTDLSGKPVPKWLAGLHAALAVTGVILLLLYAF